MERYISEDQEAFLEEFPGFKLVPAVISGTLC
jgi:hypothetical protein